MHNHEDKGGGKMTLLMILMCVLPILAILFFAGQSKGFNWLVILPMAVCMGAHFFMHGSHKNHTNDSSGKEHLPPKKSCCSGKDKRTDLV